MVRRFRAIIQTDKEPEDHEVIWKKGHKLLYWNSGWIPIYEFEASEIIYESKDTGEEISLEDAVNEVKDSVANVKITAEQALETSRVAEEEAENAQNVADANAKKLAGITLKPISETEYEALETKENDTLYLCYGPSDEP